MLRRTTFLTAVVDESELGDRVRVSAAAPRTTGKPMTWGGPGGGAAGSPAAWCRPLLGGAGTARSEGPAAEEEIGTARSLLAAEGLQADVLEVRADPEADVTRVIRVR